MTDVVKKNGVNFGIILGVFSIVATALIYSLDLTMFASIWVGLILFAVNLVIGIVAVAKSKKALGGFISFKEAFTVYFIAMALGSAIGSLFMYVLFNLIDPAASEIVMDAAIEKTVSMMQGFGTPTGDIAKTVEQMKETDNFSLRNLAMSYVWGLLFNIIIGLIVAAAFKKNRDII